MQAVGRVNILKLPSLIGENRRDVDAVGLRQDPAVERRLLVAPVGGRILCILQLRDLRGIERSDRREDGRDAVRRALVADACEHGDDIRRPAAHAIVVHAAHDDENFRAERQHVALETRFHRLDGIARVAEVLDRKCRVRFPIVDCAVGAVDDGTAAVRDAVAERGDGDGRLDLERHVL